jgi:magnesium transporter
MTATRTQRRRHRSTKVGAPPGTPIYTGESSDAPVHVRVIDYNEANAHEHDAFRTEELRKYRDDTSVTWINLDGIHQVDQVQAVCKAFDVHPLWVEDIVNPHGRPKVDQIDDQVFVLARMVRTQDGVAETEQVSIVMGKGWILTFQQRAGDVWDGLRQRIRMGNGRVRKLKSDYLLHALMDNIVDHYFLALEEIEMKVDVLEGQALDPDANVKLTDVFALKAELAEFRRSVWPMREAISSMLRNDDGPVGRDIQPFFRDLYDHVIQVMDILETSRERIVGVYELHLAVTSHRLNDIMKILTIVSTIFIPMTFVAGVYGMNFDAMPELHWSYGYPMAWLLMLGTGIGGALWMTSRKWL